MIRNDVPKLHQHTIPTYRVPSNKPSCHLFTSIYMSGASFLTFTQTISFSLFDCATRDLKLSVKLCVLRDIHKQTSVLFPTQYLNAN
mmetsp:Transcript_21326/g.31414  ORF Transcript_21326/g.31414 Transcript_21326/m.31414 type:complete len:87 (+) Transcript_21326:509-769(+)